MEKIRNLRDVMRTCKSDTEVLGQVIVTLAVYSMANKGISAAQLNELCDDINAYYEARQSARA